MNPIVDTIVAVLFVMLMVYIFRGYHLSKMRQREEEEKNLEEKENTPKE
ncbi:MAG: hypothetical protein U9N52_08230 [Campylobacterota bacterium]|nr:hypothetical protein [Campylobacterota bacterium]